MTLLISKDDISRITKQAVASYPEECCGILIGAGNERKQVKTILPVKNIFEGLKRNRYTIDPIEMLKAEREAAKEDLKILGFYHSHPDVPAGPSTYDLENAWPTYSYLIVSVTQDRFQHVNSWVLREDRSAFEQEELIY